MDKICGIYEKKTKKLHPKCNHLNFLDFQQVSGNNSDPRLCFKCTSETSPFGNVMRFSFVYLLEFSNE